MYLKYLFLDHFLWSLYLVVRELSKNENAIRPWDLFYLGRFSMECNALYITIMFASTISFLTTPPSALKSYLPPPEVLALHLLPPGLQICCSFWCTPFTSHQYSTSIHFPGLVLLLWEVPDKNYLFQVSPLGSISPQHPVLCSIKVLLL